MLIKRHLDEKFAAKLRPWPFVELTRHFVQMGLRVLLGLVARTRITVRTRSVASPATTMKT